MMAFQLYGKMTGAEHNRLSSAPEARIIRAASEGHRRLLFSASAAKLLTYRYVELFADVDTGQIAMKAVEEKSKTAWSMAQTSPYNKQMSIPKNFPFEVGDRFRICPSDIEGFDLILTKIEETDKP